MAIAKFQCINLMEKLQEMLPVTPNNKEGSK
jgi:hypothetical protein